METFVGTNEIQLTSVFTSITHWHRRLPGDFVVHHDQSSNFFKQGEVWSSLMRKDVTPFHQPAGDGGDVPFPLRVSQTLSVESHRSSAIQLCDLIAGLFAKAVSQFIHRDEASLAWRFIESGLGEIPFAGLLPRREFPQGPPQQRTGPDALDRMVNLLQPALKAQIRRA